MAKSNRTSEERYISLLTDFGFKRIFGTKPNKDLLIKNMGRLEKRPKALQEKIFTKLFKEAEISLFTPKELKEYEDSKKAYRDIKNSIDTAKAMGREEGRKEGRKEGAMTRNLEIVKNLLNMGMSADQVAKATGLDLEDVLKI